MRLAAWLLFVFVISSVTGCVGQGNEPASEKYRITRISHVSGPFPDADAGYLEVEVDSSSILSRLGEYQDLAHLKIIGMKFEAEDVSRMRALPRLTTLWLTRCRGLNSVLGQLMAAKMPADDVHIHISNDEWGVSSDSEQADSMFLATYLPASEAERVTFADDSRGSLQWLSAAARCKGTRDVDIRHTPVMQADIVAIARFPKIERVSVSYCDVSGVASIAELSRLRTLQYLNFSFSTGVTLDLKRELEALKRDRPSLSVHWSE